MNIILGIDPGSRITGFGVISQNNSQLKYLTSGIIRLQEEKLDLKLHKIYQNITDIIKEFKPTQMAIEQVFLSKNANVALKLGQARGTAIVAGANCNIPVFEYAARLVKQTVVGTGAGTKNQVQTMVAQILNLTNLPQTDAADGLALAITHAHHHNNPLTAYKGVVNNKLAHLNYSRGRFRYKK